MARIRSVHPGLASDEAYMSMSMTAKAAWPLLWTECDDHGAFEWKPIVLKARIFPADNVDFEDVLSELERLDCIKMVEVGGKQIGFVRNFVRYQRPKKPSYKHDIPPQVRNYIGLNNDDTGTDYTSKHDIPPQVRNQLPTSGEKSPQRKEEGGRIGEVENYNLPAAQPTAAGAAPTRTKIDLDRLEAVLRAAAGLENSPAPMLQVVAPILGFLDAGVSLEETILPVLRSKKGKCGKANSWNWFTEAITEAVEKRQQSASVRVDCTGADGRHIDLGHGVRMPEKNLTAAIERWRKKPSEWLTNIWGDPPDRSEIIIKFAADHGISLERNEEAA
jgi:hypothetical protein